MELQKNRAFEINTYHRKGTEGFVLAAIEAGRLLTEQKAEIPHGEWLQWMTDNLEFSQQTASRYMQAYERREELSNYPSTSNLQITWKRIMGNAPKKTKEGGGEEKPEYSATEFPETSALKEGQSRNLALLKDAWLRANKLDRKRFLKWLQKRNELKISGGRETK